MSSIASNAEDLILNADGGSSTVKIKINGTEKASIDSSGNLTVSGSVSLDDELNIESSSGWAHIEMGGANGGYIDFKTPFTDDADSRIMGNGSDLKIYTAGAERVRVDGSGNVGVGVTPESWNSAYTALQFSTNSALWGKNTKNTYLTTNVYNDGSDKYQATAVATNYHQGSNGSHEFQVAPSGTADAAISWTTAMTIDNDGYVTTPNQPGFRAYSSTGNISNGAIVQYNVQDWGNGSHYSTGTNRFTAPVSGKYAIHFSVKGINIGSVYARIKKNGTWYGPALEFDNDIASAHTCMSFIGSMNVNDYIEVWSASNVKVDSADSFSVILIG